MVRRTLAMLGRVVGRAQSQKTDENKARPGTAKSGTSPCKARAIAVSGFIAFTATSAAANGLPTPAMTESNI